MGMLRTLSLVVAAILGSVGVAGPTPTEMATGPTYPGSIGPAPTHEYVDDVHRLFLGRAPTVGEAIELAHLVHASGVGALTTRLALSAEWAGMRIDEIYRRVLGRAPEPGGQAYWLRQLAGGRTLESVAAAFHGSEEYYGIVGRRSDAYVDSLYRRLLGREPDADGRTAWIDRLERGMTRTDVAVAFYGSVESRRLRIDRLYREVLDRAPDRAGRDFWVERLPALGDVALASSLAASDERHRRATGGVPLPEVSVEPVGPGTAFPLATSWRPGCPVGPSDLRAVRFTHVRPDGTSGRGVLVVHRDVVADVVTLVRAAHGTRFPITQARPVDDFDGDDDASMAADNTSAFNCRTVAGATTWSQHAYGRAVDVNPLRNPYVRGDRVDPPEGRAWSDRSDVRPGMLVEASAPVVTADRLGWGWGGRWTTGADHQHLSRNGR